jgi:pimeloyl-ACP methyl ester carboxylesterase
VLLASYARSVSDFNELVEDLNGAGYTTLAMQARGIGASRPLNFSMTYSDYATDLIAALDHENITQPTPIIGHAWGNRIARAAAARFPVRSGGLILLAAGGETPTPKHVSSAIIKVMLNLLPDNARLAPLRLAFFSKHSKIPKYWLRGWYPMAGLAQGRATVLSKASDWIDGGTPNIVILQPSDDAAAATDGLRLQERHPERIKLVTIDGAGHALLPEQPTAVAAAILDALESF